MSGVLDVANPTKGILTVEQLVHTTLQMVEPRMAQGRSVRASGASRTRVVELASSPTKVQSRRFTAVVEFIGLVIFATIIGIGLLDVKSGLSPFATYRSAAVTGGRRRAPATGHRGDDDNQSRKTIG